MNGYKPSYRNRRAQMQTSVLEETQAFITRQREALLAQREAIFTQQADLQKQLDEVNGMLAKFDVFEGKATRAPQARGRRGGARSGSKREQLLQLIKDGHGLTRGEI